MVLQVADVRIKGLHCPAVGRQCQPAGKIASRVLSLISEHSGPWLLQVGEASISRNVVTSMR